MVCYMKGEEATQWLPLVVCHTEGGINGGARVVKIMGEGDNYMKVGRARVVKIMREKIGDGYDGCFQKTQLHESCIK